MKKYTLPKTITAVLAGGALAFSLAACSGGDNKDESSSASTTQSASAAASDAATDAASDLASDAASDTASAPASDPASDDAAAAGPTKVGGSDADVCKAALSLMQSGGKELSGMGSDMNAGLKKIDELSAQFKSYEGELKDAKAKSAVATIEDYFDSVSDAARNGKSSEISSIVQDKMDGLTKAGTELGKCMAG